MQTNATTDRPLRGQPPVRRAGRLRGLRSLRYRLRRLARSAGFTLVEMALALGIASSFLVFLTANVSEGIQMQLEADRLTIAVAIAQAKLSQLRNNPNLGALDQDGELNDAGMYSGYRFQLKVTEEFLDLADVQASGKIQAPAVDDQLPAGVQNQAGDQESLGTSEQTATGGRIETLRIVVVIEYPVGNGFKEFRVETLQAARKKSQSEESE